MLTKAALIAYITITAQQHGVDPDLALAVAEHESRFEIGATSRVGAIGLFQIMPHTVPDMTKAEIRQPATNIRLGVERLVEYGKSCGHKKNLFLVCYNMGPRNARKVQNPGLHPYVLAVWKILKRRKIERMWDLRLLRHRQLDQSGQL